MPASMRLIIGLGNPGTEYADTRHNIGFMALDAVAQRYGCATWKKKFKGLVTTNSSPSFTLLKPQTFMNLSGEAVGEAMRFYNLSPADVVVFHDDLDLQPGQVKIKQGGGTGGHNGLKSMDAHIGKDYWRVRLGIGHPLKNEGVRGDDRGDVVSNYVLNAFAKSDKAWLTKLLDAAANKFDLLLEGKMIDYARNLAVTGD